MKKSHGRIDATAAAAKQKAGAFIDATANVAVTATEAAGDAVQRAGDRLKGAGAAVTRSGDRMKQSGARILKLAE